MHTFDVAKTMRRRILVAWQQLLFFIHLIEHSKMFRCCILFIVISRTTESLQIVWIANIAALIE